MKPKTSYETFWEWLPLALQIAEVKHSFPGKAMSAVRALKRIDTESGTGYLTNVEPFQALHDAVAYYYGEAPAPFWLQQYPQAL